MDRGLSRLETLYLGLVYAAKMPESKSNDPLLLASEVIEKQEGELAKLRARVAELDTLKAELEQVKGENLNYAINVCPEQDRIITELREALKLLVRYFDLGDFRDNRLTDVREKARKALEVTK